MWTSFGLCFFPGVVPGMLNALPTQFGKMTWLVLITEFELWFILDFDVSLKHI